MSLHTLVAYIVGRAEAIRRVAGCRDAIWLGLAMVLLAGVPREYDQEDLTARPWVLLAPVAASVVTAAALFGLLCLATPRWRALGASWPEALRRFLSCYWMTGPLAWLYAIPAERMLDAADSVRLNLSLLGLVASWRVLLITRVGSVLTGLSFWRMLMVVMLFADSLVLTVLGFTRVPLFNIMGGIHLSESERVLQNTICGVQFWGVVTLPVWLIGALAVTLAERWPHRFDRRKRPPRPVPSVPSAPPRVSLGLWLLTVAMVVGGALLLRAAQGEQRLRHRTETLLRNGRVAEGLELMSGHGPSDFPPHWDPPPQAGFGESLPPMLDVTEQALAPATAEWVRRLYIDKYHRHLGRDFLLHQLFRQLDDEQLDRHVAILQQHWPADGGKARELRSALSSEADDSDRAVALRQRIEELLRQHDEP